MINKVSVTRKDLARGIDTFSAKGSIPEGHAEDLQNVDTNANGRLATRPGYEGYYGWVPIRVREVTHIGTAIRFALDLATTIDLDQVAIGPLVAYGRLGEPTNAPVSGDWAEAVDVARYYPTFTVTSRDPLTPPGGTLSKPQTTHALTSRNFWVGLTQAIDASSTSNTVVIPDDIRINITSFDVAIEYQINQAADGFVYFREQEAVTGQSYWEDVGPGTSFSITEAAHQLDTFNIIVKCFDTTIPAGSQTEVIPASVEIDGAGTVYISFTTAFTGRIYLEAAPPERVVSGPATVTGGGPTTNIFTIDNPGSPFLFFAVYRFNPATLRNENVLVNSWAYDESTDRVTIEYVLSGTSGESVDIYWTLGRIISNVLEVTDTGLVSDAYVDSAPQLTLWGIDHAGIYRDPDARGGHVAHIDSYRRVGEARVICGLGGNIFRALAYEEGATQYLMGSLAARLRRRIDGDVLLAPLFHSGDPGAIRTRGVIWDPAVGGKVSGNYARCTAATYISAGVVDYTLEFTNKSAALVFGTQVGAQDQLMVADLAHPEHSGSWTILAVTDGGPTAATVRVSNPNISSAFFNVAGARGRAGVFTDQITFESAPEFIAGDRLLAGIPPSVTCSVLGVSGMVATVAGITAALSLADGTLMAASRTDSLVPLRDPATGAAATSQLVRGDILRITGISRKVRVKFLLTAADQTTTFTGTGSLVTATTPTPHRLSPGQRILFRAAAGGGAAGYATVASVLSASSFTFAGTTTAGTATLVGHCAELDEALTIQDGTATATEFTVDGRWAPVEAPDHSFDLPPPTYRAHFQTFGYDSQPVLRSTMVSDNLYFTNQADEVMKFDGANIARAGLPSWQPGLFATNDTAATPEIALGQDIGFSAKSNSGKYLDIASPVLEIGDRIYSAEANKIWIVTKVSATDSGGSTVYRVTVRPEDDISGATTVPGTIRRVQFFQYMLRLALVDANDNVIVSAEVQSKDYYMEYVSAGQIKLKLVGLPNFGIYDYARIQIEVFRSVSGGSQRFLIHRQNLDFDNFDGYLTIADGTQDSELGTARADSVAVAVGLGAEIGTGWDQPPRAKHITSANGRLLLANLAGYPELSLALQPAAGATALTAANLHGKRFLLRRDATDLALTTANTVDRLGLEFNDGVSGGGLPTPVTIAPLTDISVTATTFTVTTATPPAVGRWVYMFRALVAPGTSLTFAGWWQVSSVVPGSSFTVKANGLAPATASDANRFLIASTAGDVPVWLGEDGNYGQADLGRYGATSEVRSRAALRMANAVNAAMRLADRTIVGQEDFAAWVSALAGGDYPSGTIKFSQPQARPEAPGLRLPTSLTGAQAFVNDVSYPATTELEFVIKRLASYVARSYRNYPELFDSPLIPETTDSDSVIPINPADGQEITAMIPFFGVSAAGGASQLESSVVVFKTNSIYLVDVDSRAVTRVDSRGLGCTAPRSVASSRNGIVFANESGVFMLTRSLEVVPVGQALTGLWRDTINRDQLAEATGHHYGTGRRYKLSVPVGADSFCSEAVVYDYEREGQTFGAWTRYTNHPATGWCNLGKSAFFASQAGDVFKIRDLGDATDFRDEDQAVAEAVITLRAEDFDLPGVRKLVTKVISLFELELSDLTDVAVAVATDLSTNYVEVGAPAVTRASYRQITLAATPNARRGTHHQVRYTHQQKDEQLVLTAVVYSVGQLSDTLVKQTKTFEDD